MVKIIATIGSSSIKTEILNKLKSHRVDFVRINLSHTKEEEIEETIELLKKSNLPIIIDTEGSKIRIRAFKGKPILLSEGETVKIFNKEILSEKDTSESKIIADNTNEIISIQPKEVLDFIQPGNLISIDFDSVLLNVRDISTLKEKGFVLCQVMIGGLVGGNKSVNIEELNVKLPPYSQKDLWAVELAKKHKITHFTLSFIDHGEEVKSFKKIYPEAFVYAEVETKKGMINFESILKEADGIMIDRGDLSKEISIEKIPFAQKIIIKRCSQEKKEVWVATNILENMCHSLKPTRAEVNDVINTILDGATGLVLTKETAVGKYPLETINMLQTLIQHADFALNSTEMSKAMVEEDSTRTLKELNYFTDPYITSPLNPPQGGKLVDQILNEAELQKYNLSTLKRLEVYETVLIDAEQIAIGTYSPLEGFMNQEDFISVLDSMKLKNGLVWPVPIYLQVTKKVGESLSLGEEILLISKKDQEAYALLHLEEVYSLNLEEVALKLFGTKDQKHPGVKNLLSQGEFFLGGKIGLIKRLHSPHKYYELTPKQTRKIFQEKGWKRIVGFLSHNAIHCSHQIIQLEGIELGECDGLFVHPMVGKKKEGDFKPEIIIKSYDLMMGKFYPKNVVFGTFLIYSRWCGPREAVFSAICKKNFGCSHFIVGRDHAGVGSFYGPKEAQNIFKKFPDLGIEPICFNDIFYSKSEDKHIEEKTNTFQIEERNTGTEEREEDKSIISGTAAREILKSGQLPPKWLMRPEISQMIIDCINQGEEVFCNEIEKSNKVEDYDNPVKKGIVVWFTGLSGSGKTTLALALKKKLENRGKSVEVLDGDAVRSTLNKNLGFSREDIRENNIIMTELAKEKTNHFNFILVPKISPYQEDREKARSFIGNNFLELFINAPLQECINRDVKGLYKKALAGEIKDFVGIAETNPYERPESPDLEIRTNQSSIEESVSLILRHLEEKRLI